jgi:hypothetical protein
MDSNAAAASVCGGSHLNDAASASIQGGKWKEGVGVAISKEGRAGG